MSFRIERNPAVGTQDFASRFREAGQRYRASAMWAASLHDLLLFQKTGRASPLSYGKSTPFPSTWVRLAGGGLTRSLFIKCVCVARQCLAQWMLHGPAWSTHGFKGFRRPSGFGCAKIVTILKRYSVWTARRLCPFCAPSPHQQNRAQEYDGQSNDHYGENQFCGHVTPLH